MWAPVVSWVGRPEVEHPTKGLGAAVVGDGTGKLAFRRTIAISEPIPLKEKTILDLSLVIKV